MSARSLALLVALLVAPRLASADPVFRTVPCPAFDAETFLWQSAAGLGVGSLLALGGGGLLHALQDVGSDDSADFTPVVVLMAIPMGAAVGTQFVHDECGSPSGQNWTLLGAVLGLAATIGAAVAWSDDPRLADSPFAFTLVTGLLGVAVGAPTGAALSQLGRRDEIWYELPPAPTVPPDPTGSGLPPLTLQVNLLRLSF